MIRKLFAITLFFISLQSFCQSSVDIYPVLQKDSLAALKNYVTKGNIDSCDNSGSTLLANSIRFGAQKCFDFLISQGADLNKDCNRKPPLALACKYNRLEMLKTMLNKGASTSFKNDDEGKTLLYYAEKYKHNKEIFDFIKKL